MKIALSIARILLGLVFVAASVSIVFFLSNPPPMPGLAGEFQKVFFASHWVLFVKAVEFVGGVLLLANRFVPLALTLLAAVISNILMFHLAMDPGDLAVPAVVTLFWFAVAMQHRTSFAALLAAKPQTAPLQK
ncbi:MAG: DoxX family membrane protein [Candidatus Eremiobacteraeota bacterium]|nr:DoxX family membrane protein [Candidatus Eremiobacteraeota bacterium]